MYTTCAFCSGALGGDGGASGLGVGKRLAFDPWKSRAWVICQRCGRWNLTPLDTRPEVIAALERMAAAGRVAATTEQVALVRAGPYDVVRVGKPPRVELAGWRYGERLKARERERLKVLVPVTVVAVGATIALNVAAGGSVGAFLWQAPQIGNQIYTGIVGNRKVNIEPPVCAHCGAIMVLRARHVQDARLARTAHQDLALLLTCPKCAFPGALLEGPDAELALRSGLTYVNLRRGRRVRRKAEEAATYVERHGGPEQLLATAARNEIRISTLRGAEGLAIEMAVDEQAEIRDLEREWRRAEEIASIADNLIVPPAVEEQLRRLKAGGGTEGGAAPGSQPPG